MKLEYKKEYTAKERELITSVGPESSDCDVEIPNGITEIAPFSFSTCPKLKKVIQKNFKF